MARSTGGRGLIQVTGRANYEACSEALFSDARLLNIPELLEVPVYAALSAGWFWQRAGLNSLADKGDFLTITKRINGGTNGLADREALYERALKGWREGPQAGCCRFYRLRWGSPWAAGAHGHGRPTALFLSFDSMSVTSRSSLAAPCFTSCCCSPAPVEVLNDINGDLVTHNRVVQTTRRSSCVSSSGRSVRGICLSGKQ